jgi:hypothetical protein
VPFYALDLPKVNRIAIARNASAATIIDTDNTGKPDSEESAAVLGKAHAKDTAAKIASTAKPKKTSIRDFIILNQMFWVLSLWMSRTLRTLWKLSLEDF